MAGLVFGDKPGGENMSRWFSANRDAGDAIIKRFHSGPIPSSLFHYTSTAALISIVRNNELWLSDATFLNDRLEIDHGRDVACKRLTAAISASKRGEVAAMLNDALKHFGVEPNPDVYVACFSTVGDDLAQWRGYGQGEAPVAIEFENNPFMFGYTSEGMIHQVRYELEEQAWIFDQVIGAYAEAFAQDVDDPRPVKKGQPIPPDEEREICARSLYFGLWRYIISSKNAAFKSEQEVRFTYTAHDYSRSWPGWHPEHPEPLFRERAGRIVPYLSSKNLHFRNMERHGKIPKLPIQSVRIGPTDDQALVARGIRKLLHAHEYAVVEILMSGSPFQRG
ncbi:DUF2971 domain-containing protein [Sphingomonas carotinifaciens]|uniref:DUF2971 domain-containing protein n=1 Tax=Sphingomonas carotinifaciens TaxID=1166323 RepID=A0A1G7NG24_9SPHN|nr:DUF2971 domain-containing protein [Sphingomonas carotinifaciens]MBB4087090.1 hypothetical protein [Sphingomonas carotinifaciens]MWC43223.1 DUF2971 domain-containing protein [Sphingomonas carotinifaciens]SDF73028.1 Protein of unknown function [Sphingomonas carotinifaciens]